MVSLLAAPSLAANVFREVVASPLHYSTVSLAAPAAAVPFPAAVAGRDAISAPPVIKDVTHSPTHQPEGPPKVPPGVAFDPHRDPNPIPRVAVLSPAFKLVFLSVLLLTVLCGAAQLALASVWTVPSANQQDAFLAMGFAWKAGLGSIFGLLGGKVT